MKWSSSSKKTISPWLFITSEAMALKTSKDLNRRHQVEPWYLMKHYFKSLTQIFLLEELELVATEDIMGLRVLRHSQTRNL
jgi:hypothetical protein